MRTAALILILAILSGSFCLTQSANAASPNLTIGVYPGSKTVMNYETDLGVKFNHVLQFQSIKAINYSKVTDFLNRGYEVILNVEFTDSYANLKDIAQGKYDSYLLDLCSKIKADGRTIWIRTLHEFNGDWYNWGVLYPGNSKADFVPAWRHVEQVFHDQNAPVKLQLNYNRVNGKDDPMPFSTLWPGDEYVDMVVITCYNRAGTDQWHPDNSWKEFKDLFAAPYNQVSALTAKPIGVAETSSTSHGGDKPQWIINMFNSLARDYPRVSQVTWFLNNKTVNGLLWDWDLNSAEEKDSFRRGTAVLNGAVVFADSFDAGFTQWNGKYVSAGEWMGKTTARAHEWNCSAKYTSNGGHGFEYAYCVKTLPKAPTVSVRSCVYSTVSGIKNNGERIAFITLRGSDNLAYAGWRMNNGKVTWYLSVRDGSAYKTVYSNVSPSLNKWYMIELNWTMSPAGSASLKVDGTVLCSISRANTSTYGGVTAARLGLAEMYNCDAATAYLDCAAIQT